MRFLLLLLLPLCSTAQTDWVYAVIGEDIFANTDIYALYMDKSQQLWVGTNNGLYVYSNGNFTSVQGCEEQIGRSIFQIQSDKRGDIYCCNLSGQIFRIKNDSLQLFYQQEKSDLSRQFYFFFDSKNRLVLISKNIQRWDKGKKEVLYDNESGGEIFYVQQSDSVSYSIYSAYPNVLLFYRRDTFIKEPASFPKVEDDGGFFQIGKLRGNHLFKSQKDYVVCDNPKITHTVNNIGHERYYQLSDDQLLALAPRQGARILYLEKDSIKATPFFLKNYFLSAFTLDARGNIFLGTFGNGILLITNRQARQMALPQGMRSLCSDGLRRLYLANKNGVLYRYSGYLEAVDSITDRRSLDWVFYSKAASMPNIPANLSPHLIYDGRIDRAFGVIKDLFNVNDQLSFLATSRNVFCFAADSNAIPPYLEKAQIGGCRLGQLPEIQRYHAVAFDALRQTLYVATNTDVISFDAQGKIAKILLDSNSIAATDLMVTGDTLYVATHEKGLLLFKNGRFVKQYAIDKKAINKLALYQKSLFMLSPQGLFVMDDKLQQIKMLGLPEGIVRKTITDFAVADDTLHILYKDALLQLPISSLSFAPPALAFRVVSMSANGELLHTQQPPQLRYTQNRITFNLHFSDVEYIGDAYYLHKIEELEAEWQRTSVKKQKVEYTALPPGDYTFVIKLVYDNHHSPTQTFHFSIYPPFWQRWWFYLLSGLALTALFALFYRFRINQLRRLNDAEIQKQKMEKELSESQLKALRSQMNPHFIFNSLNAIQDLVLQQDIDSSYDYIVLFSELVRSTLNYSNRDFIPIDKEIEFLEIYLSLEKLRFKDELQYEIVNRCTTWVEVPSLLVQPFIENALLHGLLHKKGIKKLSIVFDFIDNNLTCTITDNGIGRKKSEEIKTRKGGQHLSFALNAMEKRMRILSQQLSSSDVGYQIIDLYNPDDNEPSGTKVIIKLPFLIR